MEPPLLGQRLRGAGLALAADRWPVPPTDRRGFAVLAHGGGQTRNAWRSTGPWLAESGWDTLAYDARGHGESDWPASGDYSMAQFTADLEQIAAAWPEPPLIVGASLGGTAAMLVAGNHPEVVRALVLVDIAPRVDPEGARRIRAFMASAPDGFATLDEAADSIQAYNPHRMRSSSPEGLKRNLRLREGRWYWHWDPAFLRFGDEPRAGVDQGRVFEAARRIAAPVLLVRGTHSDVVTPEGAEELRTLIPTATIVEVDAGHMVAGDDNMVFTQAVGTFLDRI